MSQDPRTPHRVTLDVTADRYVETVYDGRGDVLYTRTMTMQSRGRARAETSGDVFDAITDSGLDNFCDEVDSLGMPAFGVAGELYELKYEKE